MPIWFDSRRFGSGTENDLAVDDAEVQRFPACTSDILQDDAERNGTWSYRPDLGLSFLFSTLFWELAGRLCGDLAQSEDFLAVVASRAHQPAGPQMAQRSSPLSRRTCNFH